MAETEPPSQLFVRYQAVHPFPPFHIVAQHCFQLPGIAEHSPIEIHMKHRMHGPFRLQPLHGQPAEQLPAAQVIVLQRGHEQALAEAAGAAQEIDAALVRQVVNQFRLVDIDISVLDDTVKALDSDGVLHKQTICYRAKIVQTKRSTKTKTKFFRPIMPGLPAIDEELTHVETRNFVPLWRKKLAKKWNSTTT